MASETVPTPGKPLSLRARLIFALFTLVSFIGGVAMVSSANTILSDYGTALTNWLEHTGSDPGHYPDVTALRGWGIFFIVVGVLAGLIWLGAEIVSRIPVKPARAQAAPRPQGYAPQQGRAVPWYLNPDVVTAAAMGGAAIAAHEALKLHREHVTAKQAATRERAAAIRAHSAQLQAENWQRQDNAAAGLGYRTNEQIGPGALVTPHQHTVPGRHTPHSDIYGNLVRAPSP